MNGLIVDVRTNVLNHPGFARQFSRPVEGCAENQTAGVLVADGLDSRFFRLLRSLLRLAIREGNNGVMLQTVTDNVGVHGFSFCAESLVADFLRRLVKGLGVNHDDDGIVTHPVFHGLNDVDDEFPRLSGRPL